MWRKYIETNDHPRTLHALVNRKFLRCLFSVASKFIYLLVLINFFFTQTHACTHTHTHTLGVVEEKGIDRPEVDKRTSEDEEEVEEGGQGPLFLAFARVFSGTVHRGQQLFILHPRYDPREVDQLCFTDTSSLPPHSASFTVQDLYLLMGREILPVESVPAGNIAGIGGLEDVVLKTATLSSTLACPAFRSMNFAASPIVRVAVEPEHVVDMPALVQGMRLLNQADPCVEVFVQETGKHVLSTAGEVHLQCCIDDLQEQFAQVKLKVSPPIIPFRETVVLPPRVDMVNEVISDENEVKLVTNPLRLKDGDNSTDPAPSKSLITVHTADKTCSLQLEAGPLPEAVVDILEKNSHLLKALTLLNTSSSKEEVQLDKETISQLSKLRKELTTAFTAEGEVWQGAVERIWAFGPRNTGPNVLLNAVSSYYRPSIWSPLDPPMERAQLREFDNSIVSGFQLATLAGPLCEEPMRGVCFTISSWTRETNGRAATSVHEQERHKEEAEDLPSGGVSQTASVYGPLSGQLISAIKEGCRKAFLAQPSRLMAAMYSCDVQATADVLGRVYAVLGRRNGRVIHEEMREGTVVFIVKAVVPVAESIGFAKEVRKKTSGLASPQLVFSHWEVRYQASC